MKSAAVGFRAHSGWAALVAVGLEKGQPVVSVSYTHLTLPTKA